MRNDLRESRNGSFPRCPAEHQQRKGEDVSFFLQGPPFAGHHFPGANKQVAGVPPIFHHLLVLLSKCPDPAQKFSAESRLGCSLVQVMNWYFRTWRAWGSERRASGEDRSVSERLNTSWCLPPKKMKEKEQAYLSIGFCQLKNGSMLLFFRVLI